MMNTLIRRSFVPALALLLAACGSSEQPITSTPNAADTDPLAPLLIPKVNLPAPDVAQTGYSAHPDVQAFVAERRNQGRGLDEGSLKAFFDSAGYRGDIIRLMDKPGTSRPWYVFRNNNAPAARITAGRRFYQANRAAIDHAAAQYGVPAGLIVAILGIETNYGSNMGNIRLADSLPTLAFGYPRRAAYFRGELAEFLQLAAEEGRDPQSFSGSFAGAMGMPQFMPSSYRKWAADGDGDGRRDIWNNVADAAASVANYMKQNGWQSGGRMAVPVTLTPTPELSALMERKTEMDHTVADLKRMGVMPQEAVADDEKAVLFRLETAPGEYRYFIGLNNFYTVWHYNNSRLYVMAVRDIALGVGANGL